MKNILSLVLMLGLCFSSLDAFSKGESFGGGRSSGGFSSSRGSSFGGSRSSGSSFGGSRSAPSRPSSPSPSKGSTFGGSRGSSQPAPIVRKSSPSSGSSSTTVVEHRHYGGHPYYSPYGYGGNGFVSGFMWGQFFNRPHIIYVGGNSYVAGPNGQPMMSPDDQPIIYESHPFLTFLGLLVWVLIIGFFIYITYRIVRN